MYDEYATRRARVLRYKIRNKLMSNLGGLICNKCNYNNHKALMIVYREFNGAKNKGTLTSKKINYYNENVDEANNDLIVLCYNCERKKRNSQRNINNQSWLKYGKKERQKRKMNIMKILNQYKCIKCGENEIEVLNIEHKKGLGNRMLKNRFTTKDNEQRYYISNPEECKQELQIMCCNCNKIKQDDNNEYGLLQLSK